MVYNPTVSRTESGLLKDHYLTQAEAIAHFGLRRLKHLNQSDIETWDVLVLTMLQDLQIEIERAKVFAKHQLDHHTPFTLKPDISEGG